MRSAYDRFEDGYSLVRAAAVQRADEDLIIYKVKGASDDYTVKHHIYSDAWECTCGDYIHRKHKCKHIYACIIDEVLE